MTEPNWDESRLYVTAHDREHVDKMKAALDDYASNHHPHGDFIMACLRNDFADATGRADRANSLFLSEIGKHLSTLPTECWGSEAKVKAWLAK